MGKANVMRQLAVELRLWQYFRWLLLAYAFICVGIGSRAYYRSCQTESGIRKYLLPVAPDVRGPNIGKSTPVDAAAADVRDLKTSELQLTYELIHQAEIIRERALLTTVFGLGLILFTAFRWKGSLAVLNALDFGKADEAAPPAHPPPPSGP